MAKRKRKSSKYTETAVEVDYVEDHGRYGDEGSIDVSVCRLVEVEFASGHTVELNAWEARKIGRALLAAADRLDGAR